MKLIIYYFLVQSAFILVGCCKDDEQYYDFIIYWEGLQEHGNAEADVFDKDWKASAYVFAHQSEPNYFSLIYETYSLDGLLREQILIGSLSAKVGKYKVISDFSNDILDDDMVNGTYSIFSDDGDVLNGGYLLNKDSDNELYIDTVDTINHIMEGRFELRFDLREEDYEKNLARKVFFKNGKFKVNV